MEAVNLAFEVPAGSGRLLWGVLELLKHPAIRIPLGILLACVLIVVVVRMVRRRRASRRVAGRAQILSVESLNTSGVTAQSHGYRIALRVDVAGHPLYEATSSNGDFMTSVEIGALQPGKTVPVHVNLTDPQDVWIDFSSIT